MSRPVVYSNTYDHGCRCQPCRDDMARYQRHRVYAAEQGRPFTTNPAGTVRRVRALARVGWRSQDIAATAGLSPATIRRLMADQPDVVVRKTRDGVNRTYDTLWNTAGPSRRAVAEATRKLWAPPLAWSDHTIDDPTATPDYGKTYKPIHDPVIDLIAVDRFLDGDTVNLTRAELAHAARRMAQSGASPTEVQRRIRRSYGETLKLLQQVA